jgi:hypothetical protein
MNENTRIQFQAGWRNPALFEPICSVFAHSIPVDSGQLNYPDRRVPLLRLKRELRSKRIKMSRVLFTKGRGEHVLSMLVSMSRMGTSMNLRHCSQSIWALQRLLWMPLTIVAASGHLPAKRAMHMPYGKLMTA